MDPHVGEAEALGRLSERALKYASFTPAERTDTIIELVELISATHAELLDVIAATDACGDWVSDGARDMGAWLVAISGLTTATAREWVRVAEKLQELPALRDAYATGGLSWDQIRPATKFATPTSDERLAAELVSYSAAQVTQMARQFRPVEDFEAVEAHARRRFGWRRDHRCGGFRYHGFLPFEMGEALNCALTRRADAIGPDAETAEWAPARVRLADSLHELAGLATSTGNDPDLACVVIHADAEVIDGSVPGNGFIRDLAVNRGGVLRALCDCKVETALHGPDGSTVGIARASRNIPAWLRRHVVGRDGCCRFPGCEREIRHVHHVVHWATEGGETNADNLAGLCWSHHRLVHEGGWRIEGNPEGELTFSSPSGRQLKCRPQPRSSELRSLAGQAARVRDLSPGSSGGGRGTPEPAPARSRGSPPA